MTEAEEKVKLKRTHFETSLYLLAAALLVVTLVTMYINLRTSVSELGDDSFYDADSMRTLNYLSDFSLSLSYIRPTLIFVSIIGFPIALLLSPYVAWTILTILSYSLLIYSVIRLSAVHEILGRQKLFLAASASFSAVAFLFVPDTFVLSIALFFFGIVILTRKETVSWVGVSFLISSGTNLFFAIPWTIYYFVVRRLDRSMKLFALGAILPLLFLQGIQLLARKTLPSETLTSALSDSPSLGNSGGSLLPSGSWTESFLSSSDALKWLHSPLDNLQVNLLSFFTAPWTVNYRYEMGLFPDQSQVLPIWIILCGISITFLSYVGIWQYRVKNKRLFLLLCITEISCLVLFITYGPHPYLFSPFLIATRALGISMLATEQRLLGAFVILLVPVINLATQSYIFP